MKNILPENPWANRDVRVAILTILFFLITSRFFTLIMLGPCLQEEHAWGEMVARRANSKELNSNILDFNPK